MTAYRFKGYWKDVGTIKSLWDANMDMLDVHNPNGINVYDQEWQIFARNPIRPPHMTGRQRQSSPIRWSLTAARSTARWNTPCCSTPSPWRRALVVQDSVIMPNTVIKAGAVVDHAIVAENAVIGVAAQVGVPTEDGSRRALSWWPRASSSTPGVEIPYGAMCTESPKGGDAGMTTQLHGILFAYRDNPHLR